MQNTYTFKIIRFTALFIFVFSCSDTLIKPATSNQNLEDFEAVWSRLNEVYPFLEFKNIDLNEMYEVYYPRVAEARGDEFYNILGDLLIELKDGHVYYQVEGGGKVIPYFPDRYLKDVHAYSPFVVRKYFDSELLLTESKIFEYGILSGNVGYFYLPGFTSKNDLSIEFSKVMEYIKSTKGLIIDLRQNGGGNSVNVEVLVSRFLTDSIPWPPSSFYGVPTKMHYIQPTGSFTYTNPVVVLINGASMSAAELTPEILKQLPNVTLIGDTTSGSLGSKVSGGPEEKNSEFRLPSGKLISIPVGYYLGYDGQHIEWNGVTPDIRVKQTETDVNNGKDLQLEYAINMLK